MNPIQFKDLKRIVNELAIEGIPDNTIVLVPTTRLLDQMRPLMTVGNHVEVFYNGDTFSVASSPENYNTKQKAIILC
jgi:superfamily II DNA or RNA helicase